MQIVSTISVPRETPGEINSHRAEQPKKPSFSAVSGISNIALSILSFVCLSEIHYCTCRPPVSIFSW